MSNSSSRGAVSLCSIIMYDRILFSVSIFLKAAPDVYRKVSDYYFWPAPSLDRQLLKVYLLTVLSMLFWADVFHSRVLHNQ